MRPALRVMTILGALAALTSPGRAAVDVGLTPEVISEALAFGRQASVEARQAFHSGYWRAAGDTVRRISLVTEFRRVVLRVEEQRRLREQADDVSRAGAALKPWSGLMEVIVELQFHPMNRLVRVPLIDVLLVPLDGPAPRMPLVPGHTDRNPRFGVYWQPTPPDAPWWPFPPPSAPVIQGSEPMTGGWLQARFDTTALTATRYDVVVKDGATTLGSAEFVLGELR